MSQPEQVTGRPVDEPVDEERWWRAVQGQDPRFDGRFVLGVLTTDISCRPSCPARTPLRASVRFLPSAAAAQAAGLRACERARNWAPYRAYAVRHLWAVGDHAVNHLPVDRPTSDQSEERP